MRLLVVPLLLAASIAQSSPVKIDVLEKSTAVTRTYWYDVNSSSLTKAEHPVHGPIPPLTRYVSADRKLTLNGLAISAADDILYQCRVEDMDVVVVRVEHNSVSNPLRVLTAVAGHPIQVSTIYVLKIRNQSLLSRRELVHKPASYDWSATVSQ